jgi:hypothetical protein
MPSLPYKPFLALYNGAKGGGGAPIVHLMDCTTDGVLPIASYFPMYCRCGPNLAVSSCVKAS